MNKNEAHLVIVAGEAGAFVMFASKYPKIDCDEVGSHMLDDIGIAEPPTPGVWIFDGEITWQATGTHPEMDYDTTYRGTYRHPTPEELAAISSGTNPWPDEPVEHCADCGAEILGAHGHCPGVPGGFGDES